MICIFNILQFLPAFSQASSDTARGKPGDMLSLKIALDSRPVNGNDINLEGYFELDNPTLFYPDKFTGSSCAEIKTQELKRLSDSIYSFSVTFASLSDSLPYFYLSGEALAGHDSLCRIEFFDTMINNDSISGFSGLIINKSDYLPEDYVRFATMKAGYPNPVYMSMPVSWEYTTDKTSDLTFSVFDARGNEIVVNKIKGQAPGTHVFMLGPEHNLTDGMYFLRIATYSGYIQQKFCVIK
jgi:hypothetical protein